MIARWGNLADDGTTCNGDCVANNNGCDDFLAPPGTIFWFDGPLFESWATSEGPLLETTSSSTSSKPK